MSIFRYRNYRSFIFDYYLERKKTSASFTYASFAKLAGLNSPNYPKLIVEGKRSLTPANMLSVARVMKLSLEETHYFEALVFENQAKNAHEKRYYFNKMNEIKNAAGAGAEAAPVRRIPAQLPQQALMMAGILLTKGKSKAEALPCLCRELSLKKKSAEQLWTRIQNHSLRDKHTMVSDPRGLSQMQRDFLMSGLEENKIVFNHRYPKGAAKFLSLLLTAPEGSLPEIFLELKSAVEKITRKFDPIPPQEAPSVYRIQCQVYRYRKNAD